MGKRRKFAGQGRGLNRGGGVQDIHQMTEESHSQETVIIFQSWTNCDDWKNSIVLVTYVCQEKKISSRMGKDYNLARFDAREQKVQCTICEVW